MLVSAFVVLALRNNRQLAVAAHIAAFKDEAEFAVFPHILGAGGFCFRHVIKPCRAHAIGYAALLELISCLQSMATVPMIDVHAYARWFAQ